MTSTVDSISSDNNPVNTLNEFHFSDEPSGAGHEKRDLASAAVIEAWPKLPAFRDRKTSPVRADPKTMTAVSSLFLK